MGSKIATTLLVVMSVMLTLGLMAGNVIGELVARFPILR